MKNQNRAGFYFKTYEAPFQSPFDRLFPIFKELITHTSGDFDEAIAWLRELDKEYKLTDASYTIDDFIEDLKQAIIKDLTATVIATGIGYAYTKALDEVEGN